MKYGLQVLATHNFDSSPAVLLKLDSGRYLFNSPEGLQRSMAQNAVKIAKLKAIFTTRANWNCMGGLPGILLTFCDIPSSKLLKSFALVAPHGLSRAIAGMRAFIFRPNIALHIVEVSNKHEISNQGILDSFSICYSDENIVAYSTLLHTKQNVKKLTPEELQLEENISADYIKTHKLMFPGKCTKILTDSFKPLPKLFTNRQNDSG
jgi:hypothetical protein